MKTERAIRMTLFVGALTAAVMAWAPRPAHAGDAGKILGVIAAGVILHEILDDDDNGRTVCRHDGWRPGCRGNCGRPGFLATCSCGRAHRGYGGWQMNQPGYRAPVCYEARRPGVRFDAYRDPWGRTSVGIEYRGRRR
jgi:hypothetical protein